MAKQDWSKPYCGVSHLQGLKRGFYVTATDRGGFVECYIILPTSGFSAAQEIQTDTLAEAQAWGENVARAFDAFTFEAARAA